MKGFMKSKPILSLMVVILLAAAIVVPLAGNITRSHAQAAATTTTYTQTFTLASCSSSANFVTVVPTLNKGDVVSGTATLASSDSAENTQSEDLTLLQPVGSYTKTVTVNSGSQPVSFTETVNGDSLQACIQDGHDGPDSDQTATITVTVTSAPSVSPTPPTPVPTPPPPIVKHIPVTSGTSIVDKVKDTLNKIFTLKNRLDLACTIGLLKDKVELIGLIAKGQNALTVVKLDFDLAAHPGIANDLLAMKVIIALVTFIPGYGCADAIVNLVSLGGIDLLKECLTDRGCLTEVERDPQVKRNFCIAGILALQAAIPGSFLALQFIENRVCGS